LPITSYSPSSERAQPAASTSWAGLATPYGRSFSSARVCLFLAAVLAVIRAAIHLRANWISDSGVDHPAGVMIAMAVDLTHGLFYRPLFGPEGYGGTRYFPLYFVLHALLLKVGVPVLLGAYLLSLAAMAFLIVGVFCLLERMGVERWLAAACAGTLLTSVSAQYAVISPHADALAGALNIWGLLIIVGPKCSSRRSLLAATLFALAWSAKLTSCFGLIAAILWLMNVGLRRRALQLAARTAVGYLLVAAAIFIFSHGRVVDIFKACAFGGTGWKRFLGGPFYMEWNAFHSDLNVFLLVFFVVIALGVELLESPTKCLKDLAALLFVATTIITVAIYGSPGTNLNHLLDIQIASVVVLGCLTTRPSLMQRQLGIYALVLATLIPLGRGGGAVLKEPAGPVFTTNGSRLKRVIGLVEKSDKPVLSENPIIPVLTGKSPYVLDPWMLSLLRKRIPYFGDALMQQLRNRAFGVVVLFEDPETDYGRHWYDTQHFGPGFRETLKENYRLLSVTDDQFVYVPIN
jgi:hypothetical protein